MKLAHSIRKEQVNLNVDSEALALTLQPRLEIINRNIFLPVIERVFNELAIPDQEIKIDRLIVNLGEIPYRQFETVVAERLYQELRRELLEILARLAEDTTTGNRSRSTDTARRELFEYYLLQGKLPFWAGESETFSATELMLALAQADPAGLIDIIRKHCANRVVLERLVLQMGEALLTRLLHLLEPEHAALVITYLIDLQDIQHSEPVLAVSDKQFNHLLWLLVLAYFTKDPGSQFNRKSFVQSLLTGMSESEGIDYQEIIAALWIGLQETAKKRSFQSSLPAVIYQLVEEEQDTSDRLAELIGSVQTDQQITTEQNIITTQQLDHLLAMAETFLLTGQIPLEWQQHQIIIAGQWITQFSDLCQYLARFNGSNLRRLIGKIVERNRSELPRLIEHLQQVYSNRELLSLLAPAQTESIERYVEFIKRVNLADQQIGQPVIWSAIFNYLLTEPSKDYQLPLLIQQTVTQLAGSMGITRRQLVEALTQLERTSDEDLNQAITEAQQFWQAQTSLNRNAPINFDRYDYLEILHYYWQHGLLPWSALLRYPELNIDQALATLLRLPKSALRLALKLPLTVLVQAVRTMPSVYLEQLLAKLMPQTIMADSPLWQAVQSFAPAAKDQAGFYAQLIAAIISDQPLDLEALAVNSDQFNLNKSDWQTDWPTAPADWQPPLIKSALVHQLRFGHYRETAEYNAVELWQSLLKKDPVEARQFCYAIRDSANLTEALIAQATPALFDQLLLVIGFRDANTVQALLRSLLLIPSVYRQYSEARLRAVILIEVLYWPADQSLSSDFFQRVLRRTFALPLSEPVAQHLLSAVNHWSIEEKLPPGQIEAFTTAIKSLQAIGSDQTSAQTVDNRPADRMTILTDPALREAVLAFLFGDSNAPVMANKALTEDRLAPLKPLSDDALLHALQVMLTEYPAEVYNFISQHMADPRRREHWVKILPESALVRLSYLLEPFRHRPLLDAAELLAAAWLETIPAGHPTLTGRELFWNFLLEFYAHNRGVNCSAQRLATAFFEYFASRYLAVASAGADGKTIGMTLLTKAERLASATGQNSLAAIIQHDRGRLLSVWEGSNSPKSTPAASSSDIDESRGQTNRVRRANKIRSKMAYSMDLDEAVESSGEPIYIKNAGLILTAQFLPTLFQMLSLIEQDEKRQWRFCHRDANTRAVHILQYLVNFATAAPEPTLVLNKILVGLTTSAPIVREIEITESEQECCQQLLKAMISHWQIISNTSIAGLQETFFQREGKLEYSSDGWRLKVQRKTLDVLVDRIPWSISVVLHHWMPQPLYVTW